MNLTTPLRSIASSSRASLTRLPTSLSPLVLRRNVGRQRRPTPSRQAYVEPEFAALPSLDDVINKVKPPKYKARAREESSFYPSLPSRPSRPIIEESVNPLLEEVNAEIEATRAQAAAEKLAAKAAATSPAPPTPPGPLPLLSTSDLSFGLKPLPKPPTFRPPLLLSPSALAHRRSKLLSLVTSGRFSETDSLPLDEWRARLEAQEEFEIQALRNMADWEFEGKKSRRERIKDVKRKMYTKEKDGMDRRALMEEMRREKEQEDRKKDEE